MSVEKITKGFVLLNKSLIFYPKISFGQLLVNFWSAFGQLFIPREAIYIKAYGSFQQRAWSAFGKVLVSFWLIPLYIIRKNKNE